MSANAAAERNSSLAGQRQLRGRAPDAAALEGEPALLEDHDPETGRDGSGVEAEDFHRGV